MKRKAKKILEKKLMENANKKYYDQVVEVEVIDKHNCELTIEITSTKKVYVTLPIAELC